MNHFKQILLIALVVYATAMTYTVFAVFPKFLEQEQQLSALECDMQTFAESMEFVD